MNQHILTSTFQQIRDRLQQLAAGIVGDSDEAAVLQLLAEHCEEFEEGYDEVESSLMADLEWAAPQIEENELSLPEI